MFDPPWGTRYVSSCWHIDLRVAGMRIQASALRDSLEGTERRRSVGCESSRRDCFTWSNGEESE